MKNLCILDFTPDDKKNQIKNTLIKWSQLPLDFTARKFDFVVFSDQAEPSSLKMFDLVSSICLFFLPSPIYILNLFPVKR